jgi:hypothetical protein
MKRDVLIMIGTLEVVELYYERTSKRYPQQGIVSQALRTLCPRAREVPARIDRRPEPINAGNRITPAASRHANVLQANC